MPTRYLNQYPKRFYADHIMTIMHRIARAIVFCPRDMKKLIAGQTLLSRRNREQVTLLLNATQIQAKRLKADHHVDVKHLLRQNPREIVRQECCGRSTVSAIISKNPRCEAAIKLLNIQSTLRQAGIVTRRKNRAMVNCKKLSQRRRRSSVRSRRAST